MRVKITLSYDGSCFEGYQIQKKTQNTIASKLYKAFKTLNINSKIEASGRTDRGVHATNQVIHTDLPSFWSDLEKLKTFLNRQLLPHIYIKKIEKTSSSFHARYDAKRRVYRYIVSTKEPSVFLTPYVTFVKDLDKERLKEAVKIFEGIHDFEYFKKSGSDTKNFVRKIYKTKVYDYRDFTIFYFEANGYLRSQIRMMVGFLLKISEGKLNANQLKNQLDKKEITSTTLAPANGLYLAKIKYKIY